MLPQAIQQLVCANTFEAVTFSSVQLLNYCNLVHWLLYSNTVTALHTELKSQ